MGNKNLGLLFASAAFLFAGNLQLANSACEDLEAACEDDEVCLDCLTYTQTEQGSTTTECRARYPGIWNYSGGEGGGGYYATFCESSGAEYCCDFDDNTSAETCMDNTVAASYWSCLMDDVGCVVEDIPCYSGVEILLATTDPTPAPASPTDGSSSSSPSSSPISFASSSSSSSSPSSSSSTSSSLTSSLPECDAEMVECQNDEACRDCLTYTQAEEGSTATECRARYPGIWNHNGGEGGYYAAFCEGSGAEYCCDFEDNTSAETCMTNAVSASYWSCLMDDVGCEVEDMPCYSGVAVNPGSSSSTSSSGGQDTPPPFASDGSNDQGLDLTPSPSAAGSDASASPTGAGDATGGTDTNSNGASRAGAPSSVLIVMCAGFLLTAIV